jgi:hypothetical protein
MGITITDKSGVAGVAYWVNNYLRLESDRKVDKKHPGVARICKWVMDQYEGGRLTSISSDEMLMQSRKFLPEYFGSDLDRLKDRAFEVAFPLIESLVASPDFAGMDSARIEELLQKRVEENPFIQFAYVVDRKGLQVTRNITQLADRSKYSRYGVGEDLSDRLWFLGPHRDGRTHITDFYTSVITGALCVTVSTPIRNDREEIVGICGMDLKFEELIKIDRKIEASSEQVEAGTGGVKGEIL